jgi:ankyrin repeat protein
MSRLLIKATLANKIEVVSNLIESSYDLNERNELGQTALIIATIADYHEITRLLLEAGCNPNFVDEFGQSALMYAVVNKNIEIVELLLKYGAETNLKNLAGRTAFDMARENGFSLRYGAIITSVEFSCWQSESKILKILKKHEKCQKF